MACDHAPATSWSTERLIPRCSRDLWIITSSSLLALVHSAWYTRSLEFCHPALGFAALPLAVRSDEMLLARSLDGQRRGREMGRALDVEALATDSSRDAVERLVDLLGDDDPFVSWEAGASLARVAHRLQARGPLRWKSNGMRPVLADIDALIALMASSLTHRDAHRRAATADALGLWHHQAVTPILMRAMDDDEAAVQVSAVAALGRIGAASCADALIRAVADDSLWVRRAACDALGALSASEAVPALRIALSDRQQLVRVSVVGALGHIDTASSRTLLVECTRDDDEMLRWHAARGLMRIGDVSALPALRELLTDETRLFERTVAELASSAIEEIERRDGGLWGWIRKVFHTMRHRVRRR